MPSPLTASELLRLWEAGAGRDPVDRALLVLQAADPSESDYATLPIAECDRRLLKLRRATFGDRMAGVVHCPACGLKQEFELSAARLLTAFEPREPVERDIQAGDYRVRLRALRNRDLADAAGCADIQAARLFLLSRAIVRADSPAGEIAPDELPESVRRAVERELSEREPDVTLDVACQECGERWSPIFDVGAFFWTELETEARRLLLDVDALARRYGWAEADILAMSPASRRAYLNLEGSA